MLGLQFCIAIERPIISIHLCHPEVNKIQNYMGYIGQYQTISYPHSRSVLPQLMQQHITTFTHMCCYSYMYNYIATVHLCNQLIIVLCMHGCEWFAFMCVCLKSKDHIGPRAEADIYYRQITTSHITNSQLQLVASYM